MVVKPHTYHHVQATHVSSRSSHTRIIPVAVGCDGFPPSASTRGHDTHIRWLTHHCDGHRPCTAHTAARPVVPTTGRPHTPTHTIT